MFLILFFATLCIKIISGGVPVPNAHVLEEILNRTTFENAPTFNDGSVFEYLFGIDGASDQRNDTPDAAHLDVSIMDADTIKRIVNIARMKEEELEENYRRNHYDAYYYNPEACRVTYNLIRQSVYTTRYTLDKTRPIRKKFKDDILFNMAILYGSMLEIQTKMENMLQTMRGFSITRTRFHWYLILYEKILARSIDIQFIAEKLFLVKNDWLKSLNPSSETPDIVTISN